MSPGRYPLAGTVYESKAVSADVDMADGLHTVLGCSGRLPCRALCGAALSAVLAARRRRGICTGQLPSRAALNHLNAYTIIYYHFNGQYLSTFARQPSIGKNAVGGSFLTRCPRNVDHAAAGVKAWSFNLVTVVIVQEFLI